MTRAPAVNRGVVLPAPLDRYDATNERETRRLIEEALRQSQQYASLTNPPSITPYGETVTGADTAEDARDALGIGLLGVRTGFNIITAALADGAEETSSTAMPTPTVVLLSVNADQPCRLRMYSTSSARAADAARDVDSRPTAGGGLLAEFVFETLNQTIPLSPIAILANGDGPAALTVYYIVQNLSGGTATINISLSTLPMEII